MKGKRIPETGSIDELAKFWDTHDLNDFQDQLEEVPEPVFQGDPGTRVSIRLNAKELESLLLPGAQILQNLVRTLLELNEDRR